MFAKVIHALAWHMVRSYSFDNLRLALSQVNVRPTIHRQAWGQKLVFFTSTCASFSTRTP